MIPRPLVFRDIFRVLFPPKIVLAPPAPRPPEPGPSPEVVAAAMEAQRTLFASRADLGKLLVRVETIERRLWGKSDTTTYYCSFCGKSQHEVARLIAGPTVFICDECVALCTDIVSEEAAAR